MVTILTGVCLRVLLVHDILRVVEGWQDRWRSESLGRGVWEEMCGSVHSLFSCCRKCTMMIRCLVMLLDRPNRVPRLCLCWDSCRYVYDSGIGILLKIPFFAKYLNCVSSIPTLFKYDMWALTPALTSSLALNLEWRRLLLVWLDVTGYCRSVTYTTEIYVSQC